VVHHSQGLSDASVTTEISFKFWVGPGPQHYVLFHLLSQRRLSDKGLAEGHFHS